MTAPEPTPRPRRGAAQVDDASLVAATSRGDHQALDALVDRFGDRVCSYLQRLVHDGGWADDLTQEVFVAVLRSADRYDPRWPVQVWLFGIARNLAVDHLRRESRRRSRIRRVPAQPPAPCPAATVEHREFQTELEFAIAQLTEEFRSVLLLREMENLSYEEIGVVLQISAKTVSSRLHRARSQLRDHLRGYLER